MPHSPRSRKVRAIASRHGIPTHNAARRSSAASWSSTCIAEARMSITPKLLVVACALSCAVALSACGDRAATGAQQPGTQAQDEALPKPDQRSEEHTSELQSLKRISYAVFCLKKKNNHSQ